MKGIVFCELLGMVEARFGLEMVDRILEEAAPPSGGAYTAVGTYDHRELLDLVGRLSAATGIGTADLERTFGRHLFGRFHELYPRFFEGPPSAFAFLDRVEGVIHVEVRKLYPEAELPRFLTAGSDTDRMEVDYVSPRPLGDFAEGLILGCIDHFGNGVSLVREDLPDDAGEQRVRFRLTRTHA